MVPALLPTALAGYLGQQAPFSCALSHGQVTCSLVDGLAKQRCSLPLPALWPTLQTPPVLFPGELWDHHGYMPGSSTN